MSFTTLLSAHCADSLQRGKLERHILYMIWPQTPKRPFSSFWRGTKAPVKGRRLLSTTKFWTLWTFQKRPIRSDVSESHCWGPAHSWAGRGYQSRWSEPARSHIFRPGAGSRITLTSRPLRELMTWGRAKKNIIANVWSVTMSQTFFFPSFAVRRSRTLQISKVILQFFHCIHGAQNRSRTQGKIQRN